MRITLIHLILLLLRSLLRLQLCSWLRLHLIIVNLDLIVGLGGPLLLLWLVITAVELIIYLLILLLKFLMLDSLRSSVRLKLQKRCTQ